MKNVFVIYAYKVKIFYLDTYVNIKNVFIKNKRKRIKWTVRLSIEKNVIYIHGYIIFHFLLHYCYINFGSKKKFI